MDRENTNLLIITIVFIVVMGGGALFIVSGYFVSQSASGPTPTAPQTFGQTFTFPTQQYNPYEQYSKTISDMTLRIEEDSEDAEAYRKRGLAYEQLGDLTSAMDDYNAALKIESENVLTLEARAKLYSILQDVDNAAKDYNTIIDLGKGNDVVYNARAIIRGTRGDYEGAIADYTSALEYKPGHYSYLNSRAWASKRIGHIQDAINDYTKLIETYPTWGVIYSYRALAQHNLYNHDAAISDIKEAIRLNPGEADFIADYAQILHELGDLQKAFEQADQAVNLQTIAQSNGLWIRARIKRDLGDFEGSLADLEEAINYDRSSSYLITARAWLYWVMGDLEKAGIDHKRLTSLKPPDYFQQMELGVMSYHLGDFSSAQEHLGLAVTIKKDSADYAQLYRWLSYARADDRALADEQLREFTQRRKANISDVDSDDWPGKLLEFLLGDLSANELLEIAQTDKPLQSKHRKCEAYFCLGSMELLADNLSKAAEYFKQSMQTKATNYFEYNSSVTELRALGELEQVK